MSQYARLNLKFSKNKDIPETQAIRIHRALSWLKCAEEQEKNIDLAFLSLWVSFNACYANDLGQTDKKTEKDKFRGFIEKLARLDMEKRIFKLLWEKFSGPVRILIENRYVFKPFWDYQRKEISSWEGIFRQSITDANSFLAKGNVPALLEIVLDRLYILRNQLIHGGATFKSKVTRSQVRDGQRILLLLVPVIIDIMLENPTEDWGEIFYPVVNY